jgi:hypothetical protein
MLPIANSPTHQATLTVNNAYVGRLRFERYQNRFWSVGIVLCEKISEFNGGAWESTRMVKIFERCGMECISRVR